MSMNEQEIRARLEDMRREIAALRERSQDSRRPVELDQSKQGRLSRMDALQNQALNQEIERRRQRQIERVDAALARLDAGEFGYCVKCGDEIRAARLEHDPTIATCLACSSGR